MTPYTLKDFIRIAKEIVMYQQADDTCRRLNSFMVVDDKFDFIHDHIEAKHKSRDFFSTDGQAIVYPALIISIDTKNLSEYENDSYKRYCHNIGIGVVDQLIKNPLPNCGYCDDRKKEDILEDTANLLRKLLNALGTISLFDVTPAPAQEYSIQSIINLKIPDTYSSARRAVKESETLKKLWKERNQLKNIGEWEIPKMNIVGNFTSISICEICSENEINFMYRKYKPTE